MSIDKAARSLDWFYKLAKAAPLDMALSPKEAAALKSHPLQPYGGPHTVNRFIKEGLVRKVMLRREDGTFRGYRLELTDEGRDAFQAMQ